MVLVSRRAGPPHRGQTVLTHSCTAARGDSPVPVGSYLETSGNRHRQLALPEPAPRPRTPRNERWEWVRPNTAGGKKPSPATGSSRPYGPPSFSSNHFVISRLELRASPSPSKGPLLIANPSSSSGAGPMDRPASSPGRDRRAPRPQPGEWVNPNFWANSKSRPS
jgi:hypothetical protein